MQLDNNPKIMQKEVKILPGKLFDSQERRFLDNQVITVCPTRGIITEVRKVGLKEQEILLQSVDEDVIDLRHHFVLPGFVDAHVHMFLHPYSEVSWEDQVTKESIVERTVRAVTHARKTLLAGYTTVRDLGTEGAEDADVSLRKCLSGSNPLIAGPRYFIANRAIVTTGSYGPKGVHHMNVEGVEGMTGAEAADGRGECRKVVRRQIGAGADWIKIYGDYSPRSRLGKSSRKLASSAIPTFHEDEITEIIETATRLGAKTTVHLKEDATADLLSYASPHSIEHGSRIARDKFELMKQRGTFFVPTLGAYYTIGSQDPNVWEDARSTFKEALTVDGLRIACGGDTAVFPHGENALELKLMAHLGADPKSVLQWATLHGWECVRGLQWEGEAGRERIERLPELLEDVRETGVNDMAFGVIAKGFAADIIATRWDPERDFETAVDQSSIGFVMKTGRVYKKEGREIPL